MEKGCAAFVDLIEVDAWLLKSALEVRGVFTFDSFVRGYWSFCFRGRLLLGFQFFFGEGDDLWRRVLPIWVEYDVKSSK